MMSQQEEKEKNQRLLNLAENRSEAFLIAILNPA